MNKRDHWEHIYETKSSSELSWTQASPTSSLEFVHSFSLPHNARIIDIGGGDSKFVDALLAEGYSDITVLDISAAALNRAKERLGERASAVNWVVSDIRDFQPDRPYDLWHDRAAFHFFTQQEEVGQYIQTASRAVVQKGFLTIGTFSLEGPQKCSGLPVKQYSEDLLNETLQRDFFKLRCITEDHVTPAQKVQNFLFCGFRRK